MSKDGFHQDEQEPEMLRGFATISFYTDDMDATRAWYTELLGIEPYFFVTPPGATQPAYMEFRVGDDEDELGFIDREYAPPNHRTDRPGGAVMQWHVDDLEKTVDRLLEMGATLHDPITPRGDTGFVTAWVIDPFGNVLGVMYNPHYVEILEARATFAG
jgi:predicted enzyme related to lactoylglutathione lyase